MRNWRRLRGGENVPKVIHFEIPAEDTRRAVAFYKKAFGWKFDKYEGMEYWLANTGEDKEPGINGAVSEKDAFHPTTINTIACLLSRKRRRK